MSEWSVCVPSFKRAGMVSTDRVVRGAWIVVPESQEDEYLEKGEFRNGARLMVCPDEVDGSIVRKRNWILDMFPGWLVMMDDDISAIGGIEGGKAWDLGLDEVDQLMADGFEMCEDLGTVMWGLNQQVDPKFYREYTPFCFLSPILGPFQGFVGMDLRNDDVFTSKEDYDLWIRVVRKYGVTLRFNKFHYRCDHLNQSGGLVSMRRMEEEKRQAEVLVKRFGSDVVQFDFSRSVNPKVRVPIKGV